MSIHLEVNNLPVALNILVVLWELITNDIPWKGVRPDQVIFAVAGKGKRLEIPSTVSPAIKNIIVCCWNEDYTARYTFKELINQLNAISDQGSSSTPTTPVASRNEEKGTCNTLQYLMFVKTKNKKRNKSESLREWQNR